jgi:ribose transport system substrate-binding protein
VSRRRVVLRAGPLALAMWAAACGAKDAAPPGPARPRLALVMKSLANEFFLTMEEGARDHQRQHAGRYDLIANGIKDELDVGRQVDLVEQMVAEKVSAIVLAPADSKALVSAAKRAADAGIVLVNIDNRLDPAVLRERGLSVPFVGPDNRKGARLAGEYLARRLRPGDAVAIVEGVPTAENAVQRRLGFEDAVRAAGLKLVSAQSGDWETAKANQVVSALLTEHPQLKAVLCANDSMALGAVAALKDAGRTGQVLVVGFDNISAVRDLVRDGRVLATVDQHADQLAVFGLEYALDILGGQATPADRETPVDLVTADSLSAAR